MVRLVFAGLASKFRLGASTTKVSADLWSVGIIFEKHDL